MLVEYRRRSGKVLSLGMAVDYYRGKTKNLSGVRPRLAVDCRSFPNAVADGWGKFRTEARNNLRVNASGKKE